MNYKGITKALKIPPKDHVLYDATAPTELYIYDRPGAKQWRRAP